MRKIESLFITISLFTVIAVTGGLVWYNVHQPKQQDSYEFAATKYGAFLAAQHAIYTNDFYTATQLTQNLRDVQYPVVQNTVYISDNQYIHGN